MPTFISDPPAMHSMVSEVRKALLGAGLDCECEEKANRTLDRLESDEPRAVAEAWLAKARARKEAILSLMPFLSDLDGLTSAEPDISAFEEAAVLFEDVGAAALAGAAELRYAAKLLRAAPLRVTARP